MPGSFKDLTQTVTIPDESRETWLPLHLPCLAELARFVDIAGVSTLAEGYCVSRVHISEHVLVYIAQGHMLWRFDGREGVAAAGDMLLIPAAFPHVYWADGPCLAHWIHLRDVPRWGDLRGGRPEVLRVGSHGDRVRMLLDSLIDETGAGILPVINFDTETIDISASLLLRYVERHALKDIGHVRIAEDVQRLWRDVDSDLSRRWTVKELAKSISVSESTLARGTVRDFGITPMRMVEHLRMRRARELLRTGTYTLEQIAAVLGYSSQYALSRAFRRSTGTTARQARKGLK